MKTMKNLKMSLEILQILNLLCQHNHQGQAASSQGPAAFDNSADEDSEYRDEKSARSQDSGRAVFYTDLSVLTDGEH